MNRSLVTTLLVLLAAGLALAGCGDDSTPAATTPAETAAPAETSAPAAAAAPLTVTAKEFSFAPDTLTAAAGDVEITMDNAGAVQHELVLLKTDEDAAALPVSGGRVSEDGSVGEIEETGAGASKSHTFTLTAGHYVFVCNISGHYEGGMRGTLTVE